MIYTFTTSSNLALVLYCLDDVNYILENLKPSKYAYILHDRDVLEGGKPKPNHYHLCVTFSCPMTAIDFTDISKNFIQNVFVENVRSQKAFENYLIHKNNPTKFQYSPTDVLSNYKWYENLQDYTTNTAELIEEIIITDYNDTKKMREFWRKNHRYIFSSSSINRLIEKIGKQNDVQISVKEKLESFDINHTTTLALQNNNTSRYPYLKQYDFDGNEKTPFDK